MRASLLAALFVIGLLSAMAAIPQRASAAGIEITYPVSGTLCYKGSSCTITWTSDTSAGDHVKIEYDYSDHSHPRTIIGSTDNDDFYFWSVPSDLESRSDYIIRVTSTSNSSIYDESDTFRITDIAGFSGFGSALLWAAIAVIIVFVVIVLVIILLARQKKAPQAPQQYTPTQYTPAQYPPAYQYPQQYQPQYPQQPPAAAGAPSTLTKPCQYCGKPIPVSATFCAHCGHRLT